ncbi:peptidylprolyl isomerase [Alicyclobacillus tolerans]|uniref:PPIC-type PPIASE domain-containing protein n=1 Tax=Alicyclobacillus tolerans TaxID=90970 RepID=A0A1M6PGJ4_9BACL|nr:MULTISPECIES: peptidylprolyl isomerase [Alicyclobacillus]QRF22354.1 hypothetical protein FY534_00645 [Alicyclobacillus sp. TC]SHK07020.1 PPIC-type PPIASE domain-containing protein [Alicyclobacillus montanus]
MQSKRTVLLSLATAAVVTLVAGCGAQNAGNHTTQNATPTSLNLPKLPTYSGPTVATYNGGTLTKQEFEQQYNLQVVLPKLTAQESKTQFLQNYILVYKYLYAKAVKADKTPVNVSEAEQLTNQYMSQLVGQDYKTQADLNNEMKKLGITKQDFVTLAEEGQVLQNYLQQELKNVTVSTTDAQNYYNANKLNYLQVTVSEILVKTESQAKSLIAELKKDNGKNFAQLADKYSQDPGVKQNHGTYANATAGQFVPHFAEACATLPIGQISSQPVHTRYGWFVMRVDKRQQLPFSQVESSIKQQLLQQAQNQKETQIMDDAKNNVDVKMTVKSSQL